LEHFSVLRFFAVFFIEQTIFIRIFLKVCMSDEDSSRETKKIVRDLKIITAISLGKNRNKDLAKLLDTDKSFASKKVKELEEQGLVRKEGEGKEVRYEVNEFNVMKFLQSRVVIKWRKNENQEDLK
jgi:DNA-binding HxlR family transcriptional regulator|tara:strand:- start:293 stop:670 length:378 start_codon:yes stop_codon:yes gene_type:complete